MPANTGACIIATFRGGPKRQWREKTFPKDRARNRVPGHLLWWEEKWPEVRMDIDFWAMLGCLFGGLG